MAIVGATGRMGIELIKAVHASHSSQLAAAITRVGSAALGRDAGTFAGLAPGNVPITSDLAAVLPAVDVVIDFSRAQGVAATSAACERAGDHVAPWMLARRRWRQN